MFPPYGIEIVGGASTLHTRHVIAGRLYSLWKRGKCKGWTINRIPILKDGYTRYARVEIVRWGKKGKPTRAMIIAWG